MLTDPNQEYGVFGKYRLVGVMNSGGMAELFLALQAGVEGFTKVVALKRILPNFAESESFNEMFLDEARLAARLDHPNIVRIYDLGEISGRYFMAMEYLPGEDLSRVLRQAMKSKQMLSPEMVAVIVQAAADGLHFAHELTDSEGTPLGLVHRDVNPSNIIVTYHGAIKIVDFGIAKAATNSHQTQAGSIKGKLAYLSPEQVMGEAADRRSDVFGLGIVLWELLVGKRLFLRNTDAATLQAVATAHVPRPSEFRGDISAELESVVMKALAKSPQDRYQTAGEMHDDLDRYFASGVTRPSAKHIAQWLEQMFGEKRAQAKKSIARGTNLTTSISEVMKLVMASSIPGIDSLASSGTPAPTTRTPSTGAGTPRPGSAPRPMPAAPSSKRQLAVVAGFVGFAALSIGVGYAVTREPAKPEVSTRQAASTGALEVTSEPEGAFIFIGGEPTWRKTPSTFDGFPADKPLELRLELDGFMGVEETVVLKSGTTVQKRYHLQRRGVVRLQNVPPGARVLVDGQPSRSNETLELPPGQHTIQLEAAGRGTTSRIINVRPGEQTLELGP